MKNERGNCMYTLIDFEKLCKKLYDPNETGVVVIRQFIDPSLCNLVLGELKGNERNYIQRPKRYGNTSQELASWDFEMAIMRNYPYLSEVENAYLNLSKNLHEKIENAFEVDEVRVNSSFYQKCDIGIGPHKDNSFSVNFTFIFVIKGKSNFCTAEDKNQTNEIKFSTDQGDLVILRAPRKIDSEDLRPIHYVCDIEEDRHIIVFREINHKILFNTKKNLRYNN